MPPLSIFPLITESWEIVNIYKTEGIKDIRTKEKEAKNLPTTILYSEIGKVERISIVPDLNSSANERIVSAGIRNIITQGVIMKNLSKVAYPSVKILEPGSSHKKKPITKINNKIEIYPINELKKAFNSLI